MQVDAKPLGPGFGIKAGRSDLDPQATVRQVGRLVDRDDAAYQTCDVALALVFEREPEKPAGADAQRHGAVAAVALEAERQSFSGGFANRRDPIDRQAGEVALDQQYQAAAL